MPSSDVWKPSSTAKVTSGGYRTRNWTNTPNYSTIGRDNLPMNGYADYVIETSQSQYLGDYTIQADGLITYHTPVGPRNEIGVLYSALSAQLNAFQDATRPTDDVMRNRLLVKALAKTADAKVNLAVTLAEASKTSSLILNRANRVYRAWRSFRRGDFKGVASVLNISPTRVHKTWLEYKYGWMPLVMDVKNGAEFFAQQHVGRPLRFSVDATEEMDFSEVGKNIGPYGSGGDPWPDPIKYQTLRYKTKYRLKIFLEVTNPNLSALQQLGLTNPALVAWELVPFSFVFDWFCQVGDWLQGLTALHGLNVRKSFFSKATRGSGMRWFTGASKTSDGVTYVVSSDHYGMSNYRGYTRTPLSIDNALTYPPVNPNLGFQKMITGLALLRAQSRR